VNESIPGKTHAGTPASLVELFLLIPWLIVPWCHMLLVDILCKTGYKI